MADNIQFRVDAVLGDTAKLQQQIQSLKTNLKLTIDNTQALQAVKAVQQQINTLQKSMNGMNFNFNSGAGGSSGSGLNGAMPNIPQWQQIQSIMQSVNAETARTTYNNGQWAKSTFEIKNEYDDIARTVTASGEEIDVVKTKSQELIDKLQWVQGDLQNGSGNRINDMSLLSNTDWFKSLGDSAKVVGGITRSLNAQSQQIEQTTVRVKTADNQWQRYRATLNQTTGELRVLKGQTSDVINSQMNLTTMLKSAIERFAVWGIAMKMWTGLGNIVNDCTNYIKELDGAMTDIRIVTMDTKEATEELFKTYNQMGQELGRTTLEVANSADTWLRQGYTMKETNELIRDSMVLSTLGQIDSADATTYLTSAMKGYKVATEDVINIVDKFVAVDLVAATSAGDLATALSRTANMARTTGVEMDKMIAIIATVQEVTQQSAEVVGNAFKTILSRMSNIKLGRLVDPESQESLNDVETTLNSMGIKLRDTNNEWRNFGDVLDEVGAKWQNGDFSDTQKSALATAFAGTRQKENFLTLMENYQNVEKYATEAFESAGLAEEKYGIYTESVAGKQAILTAKMEEFYSNILNSDFIKKLLDIGGSFMDMMNSADGLTGKIIVLTATFVGLAVVLKTLKTTTLYTQFISLLSTFKALTVGAVTLNGAFLSVGTQGIGALLLAIPKAIIGLIGLVTQFGLAEVSALGLKGALDLLNINPVMLAISALIAVVAGGIAIFKHFNVTLEEQHEKAQQAQADYQEIANELKTVNDELATTQQRIAELEGKDALTFVEQEELKKLKETNAELESQAYWLKQANIEKKKEVDEEASKAWDKDFNKSGEYISRYQTHEESIIDNAGVWTGKTQTVYNSIDETQYIKEQIQYLGELKTQIQEVENAEGEWANKTEEQRETELERLRGLKTGVEQYLTDVGTRIQNDFLDSYDVSDNVKKSWLELQDIIRIAIDPDYTVKKFEEAVENLPDIIKTNLKDADNAGNFKNLEEAFTVGGKVDSTNLENFKEALKAINVEANDPTVLNYLNSIAKSTETINITPLMTYSQVINDIKDRAEALGEAQKEMSDSGYITSDTVLELEKQFGDLSEYLTLTANGYLISKAGLDALNGSMLGQYQTTLNEAKQGALNVLDQEHKKQLSYNDTTESIRRQLVAQAQLAKQDYEKLGIGMSGLSLYQPYTNVMDAIDAIDNAQANYDKAKQAIDTYMETNGDKKSSSGSSSSKSSKQWWETALENLKDDLEYNAITLDTYINGVQNILNKLKKGSDAWKEVNKELQEAKLDRVENQFDRGEITIDQYIKKLTELRKSYKKNSEGYKELTDIINDAKYDKTEQYLDKLADKIGAIDQKIDRLGEVNTDKERIKYAQLLSQKYIQTNKNIASIRKQLKNTALTEKQRNALQEELNDLLVDEVGVRDEIEEQVREYYENQREQAEQQAELNRKEILYQKELELYGKKGKELYEWETNQKIKAIEEQIELREAEKEALDEINEREQLENDLLEAKLKLQNALNNKTTKILKKQADGTWQYEYSANMSDVKSAKEEIKNAEQAIKDFDFEQGIQELQDQADKLSNEMEDLGDKYEEAEFWADREYEQTMNGIEKAYGDIDAMVEKWMKTYGGDITKLTEGYQSVVSANNTLEQSIIDLTTAIESKYETIGSNKVSSKDGVKSFDTGGKIVGNGLILAHDKERVLTEQQNLYFESFVSKLPQLLKAFDITKFGGYRGSTTFGSRVNADKVNSTVINGVTCNFPNITTTEGLQKAILDLPRIALQRKK